MQANVRLHDGRGAAAALLPEVEALLAGGLRGFFFMRKPPGLRLRFAAALAERAAVAGVLDRLAAGGAIAGWWASCYEPETFKLGGARAAELAHAHFQADSLACWRLELIPGASRRLAHAVISLAMVNDLFAALLAPEEVWDAWCQLARLHGFAPRTDAPPVPRVTIAALAGSDGENALLADLAAANRALADGLRALHGDGQLLYRFRSILPHVALYHWNRLGLGLAERRRLLDAMTTAWAPPTHRPPTSRQDEESIHAPL